MVDEFIATLTPTLAVIVSMSILGGTIVKGVTWLNKKQDDKAAVAKKQQEDVATNLKTNNEMIAVALAKVATDTAQSLKENNERIAVSLKDNNAAVSLLLTTSLKESHDKLNDLSSAFKERADLTNGNVAAIRSEIQDFKEDFYAREDVERDDRDRIYERGNGGGGYSPARKARKRLAITRSRDNVNTRRNIEHDRIKQEHGAR